jgi:sigma-B regulation protein RsbU (phosphoserine phosphatase)
MDVAPHPHPKAITLLPAPLRSRWLHTLTRLLAPLAEHLHLDAYYVDSSGATCIAGRNGHERANADAALRRVLGTSLPSAPTTDVIRLDLAGRYAGSVHISAPSLSAEARGAVRHIVEEAWRRTELEENERSLLLELRTSWETLGAVYEISGHLLANNGLNQFLRRVAQQAATLQPWLQAIVWIVQHGVLEPRALATHHLVDKRPVACDPVSTACKERRKVLHQTFIPGARGAPELRRARGAVVIPFVVRDEAIGALEVWREDHDDLFDSHVVNFLTSLAGQAGLLIENERLYRSCLEHERLQQQIEISSTIQASLLLGEPPKGFRGLDIASLTIPSEQVDGDFWDFIPQDEQRFDVLVGDVMGKSVPAALVGVAAKTQFVRTIAKLASNSKQELPRIDSIVNSVHAELTNRLIELETFVTLCYARCDLRNRILELVDCGHPRTLHYRWRTGTCTALSGANVPLGFRQTEQYERVTVPLHPLDVLVFYSDGLTETRDANGQLFGLERLASMVTRNAHLPSAQLLEIIRETLATYAGTVRPSDDMTCVVVKVEEPKHDLAARHRDLVLPCEIAQLSSFREFVRTACRELPEASPDEDAVHALVLAAHEAAANLVEHACRGGGTDRSLTATVDYAPGTLAIRLYHDGVVLDSAHVPPPRFDPTLDRGFGLFLIHQAVDEVHNTLDAGGAGCTSLIKQITTN